MASGSQRIQQAIRERLRGLRGERLEAAARVLDHDEEVALAEEALAAGNEVWPEYYRSDPPRLIGLDP